MSSSLHEMGLSTRWRSSKPRTPVIISSRLSGVAPGATAITASRRGPRARVRYSGKGVRPCGLVLLLPPVLL